MVMRLVYLSSRQSDSLGFGQVWIRSAPSWGRQTEKPFEVLPLLQHYQWFMICRISKTLSWVQISLRAMQNMSPLCLSLSLSVSLSLTLSFTHSLSLTLSFTHSISLSLSLTYSHFHSHSPIHSFFQHVVRPVECFCKHFLVNKINTKSSSSSYQ